MPEVSFEDAHRLAIALRQVGQGEVSQQWQIPSELRDRV